ncbi:transposase [Alteromonas sp. S015]|uniref:transposase n=1 Tax=Alteromonas sp. S015 TaxID=3117401 RepID=UPI002FE35C4F
MAQSRKSLISLQDTPYYHCISRCVRRSYLCGYDRTSNVCYEHRKTWVEKRLLFLSKIFAIDISAYAVMSNHVHIILCVNKEAAASWSMRTVLRQWHKMHKGTELTQKYLKGEILSDIEYKAVKSTAEVYRKRLYDISWFMRNLNEYIARKANNEDDCTGRFWEGRFRSQALLTEKALLSCMAYVDLNPVRAKIATGLQDSYHTSINKRLKYDSPRNKPIKGLMPLKNHLRCRNYRGINITLNDYCALLNHSIELLRDTSSTTAPTRSIQYMKSLDVSHHHWHKFISDFENIFSFAAGDCISMRKFKENTKRKRMAKISSGLLYSVATTTISH